MAAYAILIGIKGNKQEAVIIDEPTLVKLAFKEEVTKGASCKYDAIEFVDTREGRTKRWRNTKQQSETPIKKPK